jgi:DNA ligase (NAD+)
MDIKEAEKRIEKLKKEISRHRYPTTCLTSRRSARPPWIRSRTSLARLEARFPDLVTPDSPTQRVGGAPLDKFEKVEHSSQMISLFDAFSEQDMFSWEKRMKKILADKRTDTGTA